MTTRRPAPITAWDWLDCTCGFACPHCGQTDLMIAEPGEPETCPTCGMRYWLTVDVVEDPPEMDVATVEQSQ